MLNNSKLIFIRLFLSVFISSITTIFASASGTADAIKKYSINLMWINRTTPPAQQQYISSAANREELIVKLLLPPIKWARANPSATVNLWYDSVYTPNSCVERTREVLDQELQNLNHKISSSSSSSSSSGIDHGVRVNLCDVRKIKIVTDNLNLFSDAIPVYFRVDILKLVIIVDAIERGGNDSAIFADLEVGDLREDKRRMGKNDLFNDNVMKTLSTYPLLLNLCSGIPENQFLQLYKNPLMLTCIKRIVNNSFGKALSIFNLEKEKWYLSRGDWRDEFGMMADYVYETLINDLYFNYEWKLFGVDHMDEIHQNHWRQSETSKTFWAGIQNAYRKDMETRDGHGHGEGDETPYLKSAERPPLKAGETRYSFRPWE